MPLRSSLHIDQLLSNVSVKYKNSGYIADWLFPVVPVKKSSDKYRVYTRDFRLPETIRAYGGVAREYGFTHSNASYLLEFHSQKDYVADRDAENYDLADLKADTTEMLTDVLMLRREQKTAVLFTTTSWSLNVSLAATAAWNANTTVSDPVPVWDTGATEVIQSGSLAPNKGFLGRAALTAVKSHVSVLDRVKYTSSKVSLEMLAGLFGLADGLKIPDAQIDSSAYNATESIASVFESNIAWLGYVPASAGPLKPASGYIFEYKRPRVKTWYDNEREATAVEVNMEFQPKIVASLSGFLIKDTV